MSASSLAGLAQFLRARYDERERAALAAAGGLPAVWEAVDGDWGPGVKLGTSGYEGTGEPEWTRECNAQAWRCDDPDDGCMEAAAGMRAEAQHIALNNPDQVLREVEATRQILDEHAMETHWCPMGDAIFRVLALPYSTHPDYRDEWNPTSPQTNPERDPIL